MLTGTVRSSDGAAVTAFGIDLRWKKGPLQQLEYAQGTFVDPNGRYQMRGLRAGGYVAHVFAEGFVPANADVEMREGDDSVRADFILEQGGTISGVVLTEGSRAPISGARVMVEGFSSPGGVGPMHATSTDTQGRFELKAIPAGGVSLFVEAPGHNAKVLNDVRPGSAEVLLSPMTPDAGERKVELVGIGATLKARDDALVIGQVFPNSGAAEAGLVPGDELVSLDGTLVVDLGFNGSIRAIRGEPGTQLVLGVRKGGKEPVKTVTVTRRKIGA